MISLVGDVGGTNTRLALADGAGLRANTVLRARNADHAAFLDVVSAYMARHDCSDVSSVCIAIAGPVHQDQGELTNRNWTISAPQVGAHVGADRVELINDLSALGYSLPGQNLHQICGAHGALSNGQALVAGLGTGFNVSPARQLPAGGSAVFEAEKGHAEIPASVYRLLVRELGDAADAFPTVEDMFCGLGLEKLHLALTGKTASGETIVSAYDTGTDTDANRTITLFARGMGLLARTLICEYLPRDGLIFAGSVARGVLSSRALPEFTRTYLAPGMDVVRPSEIPVSMITDDAAALLGCLRYLTTRL